MNNEERPNWMPDERSEMLTLSATRYELARLRDLVSERIDFLGNAIMIAVLHEEQDRALLLARERNHLVENVLANLNRTIEPRS